MIVCKISSLNHVNGMVIWPFLMVQSRDFLQDTRFMNHERIHARQQLEMGLVLFYIWYVIEYSILRLRYNHYTAYRNIVFEKEAYKMECDMSYLQQRRWWAFLKFYKKDEVV